MDIKKLIAVAARIYEDTDEINDDVISCTCPQCSQEFDEHEGIACEEMMCPDCNIPLKDENENEHILLKHMLVKK